MLDSVEGLLTLKSLFWSALIAKEYYSASNITLLSVESPLRTPKKIDHDNAALLKTAQECTQSQALYISLTL